VKTIAIGIALALASPSTPKSSPELAPPPSPAEPAPPPVTAEPAPPEPTMPPEATDPATPEPEATEPEAPEPEATEPEATEPEATEPATTEPVTTEPKTRPVITKPAPSPEPVRERGPGDRMVQAGVGVVIAGVASYLVMAAGLGIGNRAEGDLFSLSGRDDIETRRNVLARGQLGNRLAIGGAIVATAAMAVGIPLIVIGRRRHEAAAPRTMVMVSGGPGGLGLRLQSRF
jgi:hypothetical protein